MVTLKIRDESTSGKTLRITNVELPTESLTVEELIRSYVFQGAKDTNLKQVGSEPTLPVIAPDADEIALNGIKPTQRVPLDWQSEFTKAKEAFRRNAILVFVDERQVNSLRAIVTIGPSTDVKFLRLTMLMGG